MRRCITPLLALVLLTACEKASPVSPEFEPQMARVVPNFHTYARIDLAAAVTWTEAKALAEAKVWGEFDDWHLATITSQAEQDDAILALNGTAGTDNCWIGLYQKGREPDGGWKWVTRERFVYTKWSASEPNDAGDTEDVAEMTDVTGLWNDMPDGAYNNCYIMEREWYQPLGG